MCGTLGLSQKIDFVLRPCVVGVFSHDCEISLKKSIGEALARLFLELKSVYGGNKDVSRMVLSVAGVIPATDVDSSVFVETV